jgi:hypothetical protein
VNRCIWQSWVTGEASSLCCHELALACSRQ